MSKKLNAGQALVLVLLSLAVVLTLVLFILSRTVTDIAVSSREEEAIRAFSAAEAGIEKALVSGIIGSSGGVIGDATYSATVSSYAEGTRDLNYPIKLNSGESSTIWFVAHNDTSGLICSAEKPCFTGDTIKICWGNPGTASGDSTTPAVELSVFYAATPLDYSTLAIGRIVMDPNSARRGVNFFSAPDAGTCTIGGETYEFGKTVALSDLGIPALSYSSQGGLQFARARMIYNTDSTQKIGFSVDLGGNSVLPSQGVLIDSSGSSGEANRRVSVFQSWPEAPSIFESVVFSSGDITK